MFIFRLFKVECIPLDKPRRDDRRGLPRAMSTASALKLVVRLVQGSRVEGILDRLVGFSVEFVEDGVQSLVVETGLEGSALVGATARAADVESA